MLADLLKAWRKAERERLIAARSALDHDTLERYRQRIDAHLARSFPGLASARLAFCWPIRGEFDARHLVRTLRERGALTALPVVVAPRTPLIFREWHPGVQMAVGPLDIPYPVSSPEVVPDAVLLPMNGWDNAGYRLGYGAGFFDRTLANLQKKPAVIGISYEMSKMETIHPQSWDIPVDWVVTERGVYRRDANKLAFLGEPLAGEPSTLSSPVCYADEIAPGYFGAEKKKWMELRPYIAADENAVVVLWQRCDLTRSWNDPRKDIQRKLTTQPELFLVGVLNGEIIATIMAGYDGHRGWVNYLAVAPEHRSKGYGRLLMQYVEKELTARGCPKLNIQVRAGNKDVLEFYRKIGYRPDERVSLGKRLIPDTPPG